MKGLFISFEGIEGCGKSTQSRLLHKSLTDNGQNALLTREPGGTELGKSIRKLLLDSGKVYPLAELFLFLADRNQHVEEQIRPELEKGTTVICDRFHHSTIAYQAGGRKVDVDTVLKLNEYAVDGVLPDLTFFIDVPVEVGFSRKSSFNMELDRIEREDRSFHESIRNAFLALASQDSKIITIDGTQPKDMIQKEILRRVQEHARC